MSEFDFGIELENHLKYYDSIVKEQGLIDDDIRKRIELILAEEKDSDLKKEDFVYMEELSMKMSILQNDIVKCLSRIKLLYQISVGMKYKINLPDRLKKIFDIIIKNNDSDFYMCEGPDGRMVYKSEEMKDMLSTVCSNRISEDSLVERRNMLREQYNAFLENMKKMKEDTNGEKKADK